MRGRQTVSSCLFIACSHEMQTHCKDSWRHPVRSARWMSWWSCGVHFRRKQVRVYLRRHRNRPEPKCLRGPTVLQKAKQAAGRATEAFPSPSVFPLFSFFFFFCADGPKKGVCGKNRLFTISDTPCYDVTCCIGDDTQCRCSVFLYLPNRNSAANIKAHLQLTGT